MNKQEKLLNAIDQIDEKYLAEAINYKRKPAKKNNLNYVELFSLDEAKKFIDNIIYNYDSRRINT